jgi:hypothetical protein
MFFRRAIYYTAAGTLTLAAFSLPALAVQSNVPKSDTGAATSDAMNQTTPSPSLLVFNQKLQGDSVDVKYAYMPKDGFIVVYGSDSSGRIGNKPLGSAAIKAGDQRDVKVALTTKPKSGSKLWATLYNDADGNAKFDGNDAAVWTVSQLPLQNEFQIE